MSKKQNQKLITPEIMHQAMIGSFTKLNPRYMMKNPVMFVVEIGCIISLILSIVPGLFGDVSQDINLRLYNILVCIILFITILFANFAESVARQSPGSQFEEDAERYKGQSSFGRWQRNRSSVQPVEKR